MKTSLKYAIFFAISVLITFSIVRLGGKPFGHQIKFMANFFFGFTLLLFSRKFERKVTVATIMSLPTLMVTLLILIETNFKFYSLATPSTLSFYLGLLMGLAYVHLTKKICAYTLVSLLLLANIWVVVGYDTWIHRLNYGTFDGKQAIKINNPVFEYADGRKLTLEKSGKPYLLEFWSTTCGVCIEQLPMVQQLFDDQRALIGIYLVCVTYDSRDYQLAQEILKQKNITVPLIFYQDANDELRQKYQVTAFPTTVGIKENIIFHVGNIFSIKKKLPAKSEL